MRFIEWQQAILIVTPFLLLFAYAYWIYNLVRQQSRRAVLLRLLGASVAFTVVWSAVSFALMLLAFMGTSDVNTSYDIRAATYMGSMGLPASIFGNLIWNLGDSLPLLLFPSIWMPNLPLFGELFLFGGLIASAQRLLSRTPFSIEEHGKMYAAAMADFALVCLVILLWPQSSRNPAMPSVPIPDNATAVYYSNESSPQPSANTSFVFDQTSSKDAQSYYQEALTAGGWALESAEASDAGSGMYSTTTLFARGKDILEVRTSHGYETIVVLVEHTASKAELAQFSSVAQPTTLPAQNATTPLDIYPQPRSRLVNGE